MSNVVPTYNEEIDLISLIQIIWEGKWKILLIIAVSLLSIFVFHTIKPNTTFTGKTVIKPITSFEFDKYSLFNSSLEIIEKEEKANNILNVYEITPKTLLSLYVEQIEEGSLLEIGIDKYSLINKDDFDSESDYRDAIEKFVSKIEVLKPINEKNKIRLYHVLNAKYHDRDKWKDLLTFVNSEANTKVKASIINRFATIVSIHNQKKDFALKDLTIKIDNVKKDYDRKTKDRLDFLSEQASIARRLDIAKNTIASQRFNTKNAFVTSVNTDAPFYLRGYLAIEEEIELIQNRKNKSSFMKDLYKLERQKRTLEQDRTIERAVDLFNKTPLNQIDFKATIVKVATTNFEEHNNKILYYAIGLILSGMIGVVYVLIANAFKIRENNTVST